MIADAGGPDRWVAIALGRDVPMGGTRAIRLGERELVAWRGTDGMVRVWNDRCPHRGMRLSFGFVRENVLNCLYHGWQYAGSGECRKIPAHPDLTVPPTIRATVFAAVEQDGLVWVNLAKHPGGAPPSAGRTTTPVASIAIDRPAASIADALALFGAWPVSVAANSGRPQLALAVHDTGGRAMLHALVLGAADAPVRAGAVTLVRRLRAALEGGDEAIAAVIG